MELGTTVHRSGDQVIVVVPTWYAAALVRLAAAVDSRVGTPCNYVGDPTYVLI